MMENIIHINGCSHVSLSVCYHKDNRIWPLEMFSKTSEYKHNHFSCVQNDTSRLGCNVFLETKSLSVSTKQSIFIRLDSVQCAMDDMINRQERNSAHSFHVTNSKSIFSPKRTVPWRNLLLHWCLLSTICLHPRSLSRPILILSPCLYLCICLHPCLSFVFCLCLAASLCLSGSLSASLYLFVSISLYLELSPSYCVIFLTSEIIYQQG